MNGYDEVTITVTLPSDIAVEARIVDRDEPEFLSRVVLYGLMRRTIYRGIRDRKSLDSDRGRSLLS